MPMYEFSCRGCGAIFEELCPRDAEHCTCPACGAESARLMSAATPKLRAGSPFTSTPRNIGAGAASGCGCAGGGSAPKPGGCGCGGGIAGSPAGPKAGSGCGGSGCGCAN